MTKSIEDELNLPRLEDALKAQEEAAQPEVIAEDTVPADVEAMANALQKVDPSALMNADPMGTETHEMESNEIYDAAMSAYKDLLEMGFAIESKHAGANAFNPAMKALEIALKASQSKTNKKMERIKLIMEKEAHDHELRKNEEDGVIEGDVSGGGTMRAFRNDLMEMIRKGKI